jgi:hypothetical protein
VAALLYARVQIAKELILVFERGHKARGYCPVSVTFNGWPLSPKKLRIPELLCPEDPPTTITRDV